MSSSAKLKSLTRGSCAKTTRLLSNLFSHGNAMTSNRNDFRDIRQWRGSQDQAFEELCYQLRDPTPNGAELVKTGNPDGGLEWYVTLRNGDQLGWQVKYSFDIDNLLSGMEKSLKTVAAKRPQCRQLTFCVPFDLPADPGDGKRKSARQKFEDRKQSWKRRIPRADEIRIELWSEGDILDRLVRHSGHRGISWFFWNQEVFSPQWCKQRLEISIDAVGNRYTPELHVDLPVAFSLEGLALSDIYWQRLRKLRGNAIKEKNQITVSNYSGLKVSRQLRTLQNKFQKWQDYAPVSTTWSNRLDRDTLAALTRDCLQALELAYPSDPQINPKKATNRQKKAQESRQSLRRHLRNLDHRLREFDEFLYDTASSAAVSGALLLKGNAGQGKTHLFFDAAQRALDAGQPAVVILGERLSGRNVWSEIAQQMGLEKSSSEEIIGAMEAAAESSNAPFVLLLDALNDATDPMAWQTELPSLIAELAQHPQISLALSVRSTYLDVVLPISGVGDLPEIEHHGFTERELEATERFFDAFGLEQPRIPMLLPAFTNPLFLMHYCEGLQGLGLSAPPLGETHLSSTFERHLDWKGKKISLQLGIDPLSGSVEAALAAFTKALSEDNRDYLSYKQTVDMINECGHPSNQWPNTLFHRLLGEGVLTVGQAWDSEQDKPVQVVRFTFQQFADYKVVSEWLKPLKRDPIQLKGELSPGKPLREQILRAPAGWIEALAVLIPEQFDIELLDASEWQLEPRQSYWWHRALISSIATRDPSLVTNRSRELLNKACRNHPELLHFAIETLLSVAVDPDHPLNAYGLHRFLGSIPMPKRDAGWSRLTYYALDEGGALDRLIRWAARGQHQGCPEDTVELAAIVLAWTFTSPNRILRDHATKALTQLLSAHIPVVARLVRLFNAVDDPYVIERLAVASHGAILCGGFAHPEEAASAAIELKRLVFDRRRVPNIQCRDAVRGTFEWCFRNGSMDEDSYRNVMPPYGVSPPLEPLSKEQIERNYKTFSGGGSRDDSSYGDLHSSLFGFGDFGHYVVGSTLRRFSKLLSTSKALPIYGDEGHTEEWGNRWIFQRVVSLGWTPALFGNFDRSVNYWRVSRSEHKPERFGKKYQWIAFNELVARLADNYHMVPESGNTPATYNGPWEMWRRDIDPTLPPVPRVRNFDGEFQIGASFTDDSAKRCFPASPNYHKSDPPANSDWAIQTHDIPNLEFLSRRKDDDQVRWVVLHGYYNWPEEIAEDEERNSRRRRELWSHIYSWLVKPGNIDDLIRYLETRSLMGRWMPEGEEHVDSAYLAELPWAAAAAGLTEHWFPVRSYTDRGAPSVEVSPTWSKYLWEGNVLDCSINDSVWAWFPAPILFEAGELRWVAGTREWSTPDGTVAAKYLEVGNHSGLFVREDWLKRTLKKTGLVAVFGLLGEKQLFESGSFPSLVGGWTQFDETASLVGSRWKFGKQRLEHRRKAN